MSKTKKILKAVGILLLFAVILLIIGIVWLTIREYRPKAVETLTPPSGVRTISNEDTFRVMTFNTGYAGLDKTEDFFMDGGHEVQPDSQEQVEDNLKGIGEILSANPADAYFLQEVDTDSKRSYHLNEETYYENILDMDGVLAYNFKCDFVPYPLPPIGKVNSGILTLTDLHTSSASRISLPESFSWPVKTCNLKRCMLETRIPLKGTEAELVLINFHLKPMHSGEGKAARAKCWQKNWLRNTLREIMSLQEATLTRRLKAWIPIPYTTAKAGFPALSVRTTFRNIFLLPPMTAILPAAC